MNDPVSSPVFLSVAIGLTSALLGFPFALVLGRWLARTNSALRPVVTTVLFLPLVLPPVVVGWSLLELFGMNSPIGRAMTWLGLTVPFSPAGAVLAATVVGLPMYVMSARAAFEAVDSRYEQMSATLGDDPRTTFLRVTLPLAAPGLFAGAVLAFARALGEFGATIVLAGNTPLTRTIAVAVYGMLDAPGAHLRALPLVLASVAIGWICLVVYETLVWAQRRRLEVDDG